MSIYGKRNNDVIVSESGNVILSISEDSYKAKREGLYKIMEMKSDPSEISVYKEDGNDTWYVSSKDLERFVESSGIYDVKDAIDSIAEANSILASNACIVYDGCTSEFNTMIAESGIMLEKAVEDDAMTVAQAQKFYARVVSSCTKAESKKEVDEKIKFLKECVSRMEKQLKTRSEDEHGQIKYALKTFIPFNWLYRLIKRKDTSAGLAWLAGFGSNLLLGIGFIVDPVVRYSQYEKMLQKNIDMTKDAIKKLEELKKDLK